MGFVRWTIIKIVAKTDIPFSLQGIMRVLCWSPTIIVIVILPEVLCHFLLVP